MRELVRLLLFVQSKGKRKRANDEEGKDNELNEDEDDGDNEEGDEEGHEEKNDKEQNKGREEQEELEEEDDRGKKDTHPERVRIGTLRGFRSFGACLPLRLLRPFSVCASVCTP